MTDETPASSPTVPDATREPLLVHRRGIPLARAEHVSVRFGAIGATRADTVDVDLGNVGAALAGELRVSRGMAGSVVAREATLDQGIIRTLVAQRVTVTRPSAVLVMVAQHVSGEVRPLLDWRGALVAGAAFGLVSGLVRAARSGR